MTSEPIVSENHDTHRHSDLHNRFSGMHHLGIEFPFMIAPMVGVSHVAFRQLIREFTPSNIRPLCFTEMLSTRRIPSENLAKAHELLIHDEEGTHVPQLLANDREFIVKSINKLLPNQPFGFDINMGCPVKHTLRHNWGVRLMGDPDYAAKVVEYAREATTLPLSVKLRASPGKVIDKHYLNEFTRKLEDAGANWLTIHGRVQNEKHSGTANWEVVGEVASKRGIPIVCNGDIQRSEEAIAVINQHGCSGAMIARGAILRPWILWQISYLMGNQTPPAGLTGAPPITPEQEGAMYFQALARFIELCDQHFHDEHYKLQKIRFYISLSRPGFKFGHQIWKISTQAKTPSAIRQALLEYGAKHQPKLEHRVEY